MLIYIYILIKKKHYACSRAHKFALFHLAKRVERPRATRDENEIEFARRQLDVLEAGSVGGIAGKARKGEHCARHFELVFIRLYDSYH